MMMLMNRKSIINRRMRGRRMEMTFLTIHANDEDYGDSHERIFI